MSWEIRQGDALALLLAMPAESVQCCVTSPPYFGLRDYGTAAWEGGDATCAHAGRPKPRRDTVRSGGKVTFAATRGTQPAKAVHVIPVRGVCRCGAERVDAQIGLEETPAQYVAALVSVFREVRRVLRHDATLWLNLGDSYAAGCMTGKHGANSSISNPNQGQVATLIPPRSAPPGLKPKDLVGIPWRVAFALQADGWWLRSDIIWAKPNPMPESVTDRPTKAHEYLFLLSKSASYYYDATAILEPQSPASLADHLRRMPSDRSNGVAPDRGNGDRGLRQNGVMIGGTRNRRSVWTITTEPFSEAHFATFPQALVEPCILAGSRPGDLVLDPFAGSGTVGVVSLRHGRRFLGLELNSEYAAMARRRIAGPLFAETTA